MLAIVVVYEERGRSCSVIWWWSWIPSLRSQSESCRQPGFECLLHSFLMAVQTLIAISTDERELALDFGEGLQEWGSTSKNDKNFSSPLGYDHVCGTHQDIGNQEELQFWSSDERESMRTNLISAAAVTSDPEAYKKFVPVRKSAESVSHL